MFDIGGVVGGGGGLGYVQCSPKSYEASAPIQNG